jgi:hypothetical protein
VSRRRECLGSQRQKGLRNASPPTRRRSARRTAKPLARAVPALLAYLAISLAVAIPVSADTAGHTMHKHKSAQKATHKRRVTPKSKRASVTQTGGATLPAVSRKKNCRTAAQLRASGS